MIALSGTFKARESCDQTRRYSIYTLYGQGENAINGALKHAPRPRSANASVVTQRPQLFEQADQRQTLARRFTSVRRQQLVQIRFPAAQSGKWLITTFVAKLRGVRPYNLPHDLSGNPHLATDRLDRLPLNEIRPADLRDRLHHQHPDQGPRAQREPS